MFRGLEMRRYTESIHTHMQGGARRLAEIIVGFALGLDLSTLAAIASGQFATAHEKLGRNRPTHGLKDEHLNRDFFAMVLGSRGRLVDWSRWNVSDQVTRRGMPLFFTVN